MKLKDMLNTLELANKLIIAGEPGAAFQQLAADETVKEAIDRGLVLRVPGVKHEA